MRINIGIVEDSPKDAQRLADYLKEFFKNINQEYSIEFFDSGISFLDKYVPKYDVVFMDVEMPGMNGLDVAGELRELDKDVLLIFVTNMAQYAAKGYDVDALGYIVKPVTYESLVLKLQKVVQRLKQRNTSSIVIGNKNRYHKINVADIKYVEITGHSLTWHTIKGVYTSTGSLKNVWEQLGTEFAMCNQCYLVNLKYCEELNGMEVSVGGETLLISRYKRAEFLRCLNKYLNGL